jgi:uncharacterized oxidoreductase
MRVADKVALVTGASSGIGKALALELCRRGAQVFVTGRDPARLAATHAAAGAGAGMAPADLERAEERERVVAACRERMGRIDLLVNCAGRLDGGLHEDLSAATVRGMVALNLEAPMHLSALVLPEMKARRSGALLQVASMSARLAVPATAAYAATKAGLAAFGEALAREVAGQGVEVLVAFPGATDTPLLQGRDEQARRVLGIALQRAEDIAGRLVTALERGRRAVYPRRGSRLEATVAFLFPGLVDRVVRGKIEALRRYFG